MIFLVVNLALASAQAGFGPSYRDWCIDEHTGMMACTAGTTLREKLMNASQCYYELGEESLLAGRSDWLLNRQEGDQCPTPEMLEQTGDMSSPAYCVLDSMGYLWPNGGVRGSRVKKDLGEQDIRVLEYYANGNNITKDPSGFKNCMVNSNFNEMLPELYKCQEKYPDVPQYRKQIKRFVKRWAAFNCLRDFVNSCQNVWRDEITEYAWSDGKSVSGEMDNGDSCCSTMTVEGMFGAGTYQKVDNLVRNGKPVYYMDAEPNEWCIFYEGWWKVEYCDWLSRNRNSQGYVWSQIDESCPADIGAQWRYYAWEGGANSGPVDETAVIKCA